MRNSLDSRETITKKRLEWAEVHHPEILKMSPYYQMDALGLRVVKNRRRKKKTLKNDEKKG